MKVSYFLLLCAILMVCELEGKAQPGADPRINPVSTCNEDYLSKEYVFVGQVRAVKEIPTSYVRPFWKTTVAIETSLKGQLSGEIEVTLPKPLLPPIPESEVIGKRFIFTANSVANLDVNGLYSQAWSTAIDNVSPEVMSKVIDEIRAVLRGVPQPRIVGTVKEQSLETGFQADHGRPLTGLVVMAASKDGQEFKAKTDQQGNFQFDKLPAGMYAVYPILPKKMDLNGSGFTQDQRNRYIPISERLCSVELNFIAQETGKVFGRIEGMKGDRSLQPFLSLYPLDPKSQKIDSRGNYRTPSEKYWLPSEVENTFSFSFDHVPVGLYVLSITTRDQTIYYPGVAHSDHAQAIKVVAEKPTELRIKLP